MLFPVLICLVCVLFNAHARHVSTALQTSFQTSLIRSNRSHRAMALFDTSHSNRLIPPAAHSVPSAPDALLAAAVDALAAQSQSQSQSEVTANDAINQQTLFPAAHSVVSAPLAPIIIDDQLDVILKVLGNNRRSSSGTSTTPSVFDPLEELRLRKSEHYCTFANDCINCVTPNHTTCCYKTRKGAGQRGICKCTDLSWEIRGHCD